MTPVYGLFGSGEFLPWAGPVDRWLVEASGIGGTRVLVVPTASAPEGDAVFWRWAAMGREHYRALQLEPEVVELRTKDDAERPDLAAAVEGASLIFFSGGNPAHLVRTLKGTGFWAAVERAVAAGCALAGSSAGISFLGAVTVDAAVAMAGGPPEEIWVEGLQHFPNAVFGPHWDALEGWSPGTQARILASVPPGGGFLGIDEDTAAVGDGLRWEVRGRGAATILAPGGERVRVASGERFELALGRANHDNGGRLLAHEGTSDAQPGQRGRGDAR